MTNLNQCRIIAAAFGTACVVLSTPTLAKPSKARHHHIDAGGAVHVTTKQAKRHARNAASARQMTRQARRAHAHRRYAKRQRAQQLGARQQVYPGYVNYGWYAPTNYGAYGVSTQVDVRHAPRRVTRHQLTSAVQERRTPRRVRTHRPQAAEVARQAGVSSAPSGPNIVAEARRWIGTNPTGRSSLWCGRFMNFVLQRTGHRGTGSDMARSFASAGQRVAGPQVGALAVMSRGRGGGHVGVVSGIDGNGNPIIISGNHGRRVAEAVYPRSRIYAYVLPTS